MKSSNENLIERAESGDIEAVRECITLGADVNATDDYRSTALILSSIEGHLEIVKFLVDQGTDVNMKDEKGRVALDIVCSNPNRSDVVKFLESLNK